MSTPASIVITTRNRCSDTLRAVASCVAQEHRPLEVLVFDDASEDGTAEAVAEQFADAVVPVRVFSERERQGYIVLRNRGFSEARGEIVFSIDDDAYFTDPHIVSDVVEYLRLHPTAGACAIPYVEPVKEGVKQGPVESLVDQSVVRSYVGCAHAIRVDVAKKLGGYREFLVHQGEERDLSIRMMEEGYTIGYAQSEPIAHLYSSKRSINRQSYYNFRNTLLFSIVNTPLVIAPLRFVYDLVNLSVIYPLRSGKIIQFSFLRRAFSEILSLVRYRKPVNLKTYFRWVGRVPHAPAAYLSRGDMPRPLQ